jgi:hypothetical protein
LLYLSIYLIILLVELILFGFYIVRETDRYWDLVVVSSRFKTYFCKGSEYHSL